MPPARTGVAEYSAALLPALKELCEVRMNASSADVCLYHIGNNELHRFIYRTAFERPGAVVLHDAVLHHFFLGSLTRDEYVAEFAYNYGEWSRGLAAQLWENRARSAQDPLYFNYGMLRRIAETAKVVIVHNPAAARRIREHAPEADIAEIPHLYAPPALPPYAAAARWRERHGIAPGTYLFGVFGHLRESKRLASVLAAFERVRDSGRDTALLVAGDFVSRDLERALLQALGRPGVIRQPHAPEAEFWLMAMAVDACVNLRYPAAGETSGIAIRMMGLGKPVIVTAGEETERFPEPACLKVDCGLAEQAMLAEYMRVLTAAPALGREIGLCAAGYIAANHDVRTVARRYFDLLCEYSHSSQ
ncbi:MAG TPA: glycosyltransferase [Bryobacteraceae bacterium]|nr:glycosyltransferase [Bryobacteraceae bacterium]